MYCHMCGVETVALTGQQQQRLLQLVRRMTGAKRVDRRRTSDPREERDWEAVQLNGKNSK